MSVNSKAFLCFHSMHFSFRWKKSVKLFFLYFQDTSDQNVIVSSVYLYCHGDHQWYWYGALYIYKGLLLAFGAFLAWETRHVKVAALNDSTYIGICVYNVVVMCVFGVPLSHMLPLDQTDLTFVLSSALIVFCTTLCVCIIFVPKVSFWSIITDFSCVFIIGTKKTANLICLSTTFSF